MHFTMMKARSNSTAPTPYNPNTVALKESPCVMDNHDLDDDDADSATTATTSVITYESSSSPPPTSTDKRGGREEDGAPRQLHCSKKSKIETSTESESDSEEPSNCSKSKSQSITGKAKNMNLDDASSSSSSSTTSITATSTSHPQSQSSTEQNNHEQKSKPIKLKPKKPKHPSSYLPFYLRNYCEHSHGDFFISPFFDARLVAQLMYEGFLPIATSKFLVPKLHQRRSVIYPLNKQVRDTNTSTNTKRSSTGTNTNVNANMNTNTNEFTNTCAVHTSKSTKKKAKRFTFTVNSSFEKVVQGCHHQHGVSWLYPSIVRAFRQLHSSTCSSDSSSSSSSSSTNNTPETFPIRLYSIEVYNAQTGKLAGGELGYAFGKIYTSLTGFAAEDSAGSVQLAALGTLLWSMGFDMWDMGMSLDYKAKLGAREMERDAFVRKVKELRVQDVSGGDIVCNEPRNCKDILQQCKRIVD
eukprot:CAMPEP_0204612100 /NCGR_PEP_ID=MMETSP0717-20131115/191_1 /ASSEMBLY_ACC=CAM_ASM_000666 /TAXON_ID=230516 /ORGANISM="Chaetoceros curvisetus" /LENGTH=468 /DNA_ID=CAMNT_0051624041 /DNA_START=17 /DNA_END=1423 /DNA_ORIENTATION=-